jgi:uncharacterized membrane protein
MGLTLFVLIVTLCVLGVYLCLFNGSEEFRPQYGDPGCTVLESSC